MLVFGLLALYLEPYQQERLGAAGLATALSSVAVVFGACGMAVGIAFAGMLGILENRRTLGDLSLGRTAVLGAATAAGLHLLGTSLLGFMWDSLPATAALAAVGALSAATTLGVAQRGSLASVEAPPPLAPGDDELLQPR